VGLLFTIAIFWATRLRDRRVRQAELLRDYTNDLYDDERMTSIFMAVDHNRYAFDSSDYGTDKELALIRLLDLLNILGHNWDRKIITLDKLIDTTLGYVIVRLSTNKRVIDYLKQIQVWDAERYTAGTGFGYFRELAVALANYPPTPNNNSRASRAIAGLTRYWYARKPKVFARSRPTLPRPVDLTVAAMGEVERPGPMQSQLWLG
jgi:hypothetical protein